MVHGQNNAADGPPLPREEEGQGRVVISDVEETPQSAVATTTTTAPTNDVAENAVTNGNVSSNTSNESNENKSLSDSLEHNTGNSQSFSAAAATAATVTERTATAALQKEAEVKRDVADSYPPIPQMNSNTRCSGAPMNTSLSLETHPQQQQQHPQPPQLHPPVLPFSSHASLHSSLRQGPYVHNTITNQSTTPYTAPDNLVDQVAAVGLHSPNPHSLSTLPATTTPSATTTSSTTGTPNDMILFYEAQMRDHAVAYASAAAGAAWAAAQVATQAMEYVAIRHGISSPPPPPPPTLLLGSHPLPPPPLPPPLQQQFHPQYPYLPSPYPSPNSMGHASPVPQQHHFCTQSPQLYNGYHGTSIVASSYQEQPHYPLYGPQHHHPGPHHHPHPHAHSEMTSATISRAAQMSEEDGDVDANQPRKRQQRWSPATGSNKNANHSVPVPRLFDTALPRAQQRDKIRRRMRSDNDSSSSGGSWMRRSHGNSSNCSNGPTNNDHPRASSSTHGTSTGHRSNRGSNHHHHNKKKKARSDESLIGKTGIAALFEWCSKRPHQPTPTFTLHQKNPPLGEFECVVHLPRDNNDPTAKESIDGCETSRQRELGRGFGLQKGTAKQEAARRALLALLPGVVFDDETGILVELPLDEQNSTTAYHLEDLAPNLARQLAIGRDDGVDNSALQTSTETRSEATTSIRMSGQPKRSLGVYPETSTTSEDEHDPSTYYASRGASVCSVLLYAMIQIDSDRIPEAPAYTYEVSSLGTPISNGELDVSPSPPQSKSKVITGAPTVARFLRGSFTCTARLKVLSSIVARKPVEEDTDDTSDAHAQQEEQSVEILEAFGIGGTKREARHVASAKLLALLFPECSGMAEVKAAADAMRERYAASKAHKQQGNNGRIQRISGGCSLGIDGNSSAMPLIFAFHCPDDPPLPLHVEDSLNMLLDNIGTSQQPTEEADGCLPSSVSATALKETPDLSLSTAFRQKQVDALVDIALQSLNEQDEDGRASSRELSEDDVGRTILRKAEPDDASWIKNLFEQKSNARVMSPGNSFNSECVPTATSTDESISSVPTTVWSPTSSSICIVLLLCRAISAHEDPPLGCAVLTLGFSMETGRALRLAEIANEPHLPRERFIECLQDFASCMKCSLSLHHSAQLSPQTAATSVINPSLICLRPTDFIAIVKSHINVDEKPSATSTVETRARRSVDVNIEFPNSLCAAPPPGGLLSQLQSVQEESEVSEDSSGPEKRPTLKQQRAAAKPSKRSRFA